MSLKKVEQVKSDKGFKIFDLIIYGTVAVLVAVVFLSVFLTRDKNPFKGVRVYVENTCVYEYSFAEGSKIPKTDVEVETSEADGKVTVRIGVDKDGYNVVEIDTAARSVKVTKANCGRLDCIYTPAITDNNGVIYCSPHRLRVVPYNFELDDDIIII